MNCIERNVVESVLMELFMKETMNNLPNIIIWGVHKKQK